MKRVITASIASLALLASSTAAVAAEPGAQAPVTQAPAPGAWMMLSNLSASQPDTGSAARPADVPPPPPPPPGPPPGYAVAGSPAFAGPVFLPLFVWIGLAVIVASSTHNHDYQRPNSPA